MRFAIPTSDLLLLMSSRWNLFHRNEEFNHDSQHLSRLAIEGHRRYSLLILIERKSIPLFRVVLKSIQALETELDHILHLEICGISFPTSNNFDFLRSMFFSLLSL